MKIKKGIFMRPSGDGAFIVGIGEAAKALNGMIKLNDTGMWLFDEIKKECSKEELLAAMKERYEGVDEDVLKADLEAFLSMLSPVIEE
ncbi:MAG: PqqD family protein [Eubacteriales bacterium]|nr:PqqD family protein [Eubacteriales bacterium]